MGGRWWDVSTQLRSTTVDADAFGEMETFVHDYLAASVENETDGSRMRWYPWHSAAYRFNHTLNVVDIGSKIAADSGADTDVVRVAALFHDVAKLEADQQTHPEEGARVAREYLETHVDVRESFVDAVCEAVAEHTYDGDLAGTDPELRSLIEADMLDKIGANGALLMCLRMGYEARTHMDAAEMIDRVVERGESVGECVHSDAATSIAEKRVTRARWIRDWLVDEVAEMTV
jgi:uncharacterized protein